MSHRCDLCILKDALNLLSTYLALVSAAVLSQKFSPEKRKYLTLYTMLSNEPDELLELTDEALERLAFGMLLPPFNSPKVDTKYWSERASP